MSNRTTARNRAEKEQRVAAGQAHAALVYDDHGAAVGWCQFGPVAELPRIKHRREYLTGAAELPDWRITCFFVDRGRRHQGVAAAGLRGALAEITRLGGGVVESYPEDVTGRRVSGSSLYSGTLAMFEREGFSCSRRLGRNHWVVTRTVPPRNCRTAGSASAAG